jgi:PAS domain S-box-containing protein
MSIYSIFKPPSLDNPEKDRAARLLYGLLWLTMGAFSLLAISTAFFQPENNIRALIPTLLIILISIACFALLARGRLIPASALFVLQLWLVVTISAITGGGMETPAVQGYLLVILAAGLLIGWRWGMLTGLICTFTQLAITYAENQGLIGPYQGIRTPVTYLIVYALITSLVVIFIYYYTASIRASLGLAKQELSERKRAEHALRESEARMKVFADATFEGIAISLDETILETNAQFAQMLGYGFEEILGTNLEQLVAPESWSLIRRNIKTYDTDPYEAVLIRKNGSRFPVEIRGRPFEYHGRLARLSAVRDMSERKRAELEIKQTDYLLRERIKELTTLHQVAQVLQLQQVSVPEILREIVTILPGGWQYPEIAEARIIFDGDEFKTTGFIPTSWMQHTDFQTRHGKKGAVEIAYGEEISIGADGPFFAEELNVINTVAEMLQTYLGRREAEEHGERQLAHITSLLEELQRRNLELALAYDVTLEGWSKALDLRDKETEGHTQRVTNMTMQLARAMRQPDNELAYIRQGALLHDVGKLGIPDSILLKTGNLTDEEWVIMQKHPVHAYEWLSPIEYLRPALDIPYCHHEKWDGSGYPRGLSGEAIPLSARIFAVVDVYDALTSDRPYRAAWTRSDVRKYLHDQSGKLFDPEVVHVFLDIME